MRINEPDKGLEPDPMVQPSYPAAFYTVKASINEPLTYSHTNMTPASINEPPANLPAVPVLTSLVPNTVVAGGAQVTMHALGTGFASWTVLTFNGVDKTPTLVSGTDLSTRVDPTLFPKGSYPIKVRNGSFLSNAVIFTVT